MELRVNVDHSLHASQPCNAAAAKKANAILQCITSSEECKTQEVDTLALHGIPEASAAALRLAVGSTPQLQRTQNSAAGMRWF